MVALTLGKIKLVNRGTWSGTATYSLGDVVEYQGYSYVYRNSNAKPYTSLFFSNLSGFPLTGTASFGANSNNVTVNWTTPLQSINDNRITADGTLAGDLYIYSSYIEPDSRIVTITNTSTTQSLITMSRYSTNNTAVSGNSVTIGPRRLAGTYEVALNKTDWDRLSEGYVYAGVWGSSNSYVEGSIVTRNSNSYLCTFGNSGIDPLFDYVGVWEPFLVGSDALPHERIVTGVNSNPIYWRGHPYVPNPPGGPGISVNTFTATFTGTFNGSSQYISTTSAAALSPGSGDLTLEAWVQWSDLSTAFRPICQNDQVGSSSSDKFYWAWNSTYGLTFGEHSTSNNAYVAFTPLLNTWYHLATVRQGGVIKHFINGVQQIVTNSTIFNSTSFGQNGFTVGAMSTPYYMAGSISNFRYVVGTALYTTGFTPPTQPLATVSGTQLLTLQSSTLVDNSGQSRSLSNTGSMPLINAFPFAATGITWTAPAGVTNVSYLVVAGGGAGTQDLGGGGGGGGVLQGNIAVIPGNSYSIVVGTGGNSSGANGTNSSFAGIVTTGGGGGNAGNGGSGGGVRSSSGPAGTGIAGQGFNGGYAPGIGAAGGGGGGAGGPGTNATTSQNPNGGPGVQSSITGSTSYYGGGGGGGGGYSTTPSQSSPGGGSGGLGGGGAGGSGPGGSGTVGTAGTTNTGGGGGGGGVSVAQGNGGNGIVILAYTLPGTNYTYTGIPWNLPVAQRTNYWSGVWNTPWQRGYMDYRGSMDYGADGRGNRITKAYGYYGNAPGTSDSYRDLAGEHAAQHNQDYFTDTQTHWGYETFATNFPKSQAPRVTQALHSWANRFQLMSNGTVQGSGYPYYGVLTGAYGNDQTWPLISIDRSQFNNRSIVKMTTGECYSRDGSGWCMALDEYGELWCWGANDYGQCGVGPENFQTVKTGYRQGNAATNPVVSPVCLEKDINFNGNRIVDIFTMYRSAFALDETGVLWAWGRNNYGQLGYPTTNSGLFANSGYSCAPYPIPINWSTYGGIQKVFCSSYENSDWLMVLDGQGNVWNCGYNDAGQLGRNSTTSDSNASTIQRSSVIYSWTGTGSIRNIWAVNGGCSLSYYSDSNNQLWGMGNGGNYNFGTTTGNQLLPILMYGPNGPLTNIVMITNSGRNGGNTQLALDINGIAYACGWNQYGEGGIGYATYPGNNNSINQQYGQNASLTGWARVMMPSNIYENGTNQVVDMHGYGDYDGTSGHVPLNIWRTARGEVFTAGRGYNYSTDIQSGDKYVPYPVKNMS